MKNRIFRKGLVLGIIVFFVGAGVIPSIGGTFVEKKSNLPISDGNTLYVGGTGEGNYTSIQDAIDNASAGDTVFVYNESSPYYENVVVDKSINLVGEDKNTTVIDGNYSGSVVNVSADWVNISGFTIKNTGDDWDIAGIDISSNYNTIAGNIISNNYGYLFSGGITLCCDSYSNTIAGNYITNNSGGINLWSSSGNTITGNNISYSYYDGIRLWWSYSNTIIGNTILNNDLGIYIRSSSNNTITGNTIFDDWDDGISLDSSSSNNIIGNTITANYGSGLNIDYSSNNTITGNTISNNEVLGILFDNSNNNNITSNVITSNNEEGIFLIDSNKNSITRNNISENEDGIELEDSNNNIISENTINSNYDFGIEFHASSEEDCTDNTINYNTIKSNNQGIYLENSSSNTILKNNFLRNKGHAFFENCKNTWNRNYWNRPRLLPKLIPGAIRIHQIWPFQDIVIRWFNIDWHPALRPYDI